jgi:hypothetical protein
MEAVKVIGFDIAKSVFQVHGINAEGTPPTQASPCPAILPEAAAVPCRH